MTVLIQQHLALWFTSDNNKTVYEADLTNSYALVRSGKYIKIAEDRFGEFAGGVISNLLLLGHARIGDLAQAYKLIHLKNNKSIVEAAQDPLNVSTDDLKMKRAEDIKCQGHILESLHVTLCDLLQAGLVTTVHESHFRSDADNRSEAEKEQPRPEKWVGKFKLEQQAEWERGVLQKLYDWRHGTQTARDEIAAIRRGTKRPLEDPESNHDFKRLQLYLPITKQIISSTGFEYGRKISGTGYLDDNLVLRVNHYKFDVLAKNLQLTDFAENCIGLSTAKVYAEVLRKLEPKVLQCKPFGKSPEDDNESDLNDLPQVSTHELASLLKGSIDFAGTIGHSDPHKIDLTTIDHPKKLRKKESMNDLANELAATGDPSSGGDEDYTSDDSASSLSSDVDSLPSSLSYSDSKPASAAVISSSQKIRGPFSSIRQHLLLLCEAPHHFLHHLPRTSSIPEKWAVDFQALGTILLRNCLIQTIASRFGPLAMRLVNILIAKGKLDEKSLSTLSLISQKPMRALLTGMHKAGMLEVQEIPRDNNRQSARTLFLWAWEPERVKLKVLEGCFAAMARLIRRLGIERERMRGVVEKAARSDVIGREEEFLSAEEMKALGKWRGIEERIWAALARLDDCVAVLRDF